MKIHLERATTADLKPLFAFAEMTFRDSYERLNEPVFFEKYMAEQFNEPFFLQQLNAPDSQFWLAKKEADELVGYFKLNFGKPHDAFIETKITEGRMVELERIYVRPDLKGQRIGPFLIERIIEKCIEWKADYIWLGVWEENPAAIKFYEKHGFEFFGKHLFHLGDLTQADWLMRFKIE